MAAVENLNLKFENEIQLSIVNFNVEHTHERR